MPELRVHSLPEAVAAEALVGGTAVVIDVLRATTTIAYALAAGARAVVPCLTIVEARLRAAEWSTGEALLAGERGGLPIAEFDLGNSPAEFTHESVGGKYVVLTTTNGTKALLHCRQAEQVLVGAFANIGALCDVLAKCPRVDLVCAGTDGQSTEEDLLVAGAIVARLTAGGDWTLDQAAEAAGRGWQSVVREATGDEQTQRIVASMRGSRGGQNLIGIGMQHDIELAARRDVFAIVPRYDPASGLVTVDAAPGGFVR